MDNYSNIFYNHENIIIRTSPPIIRVMSISVSRVFSEFLAPGAPCEINIDGKTMERTHKEMKIPSRFTFDGAAEHVYTLLLKKDCYPRFIRSEHYKNLLANGVQPSARRRYIILCIIIRRYNNKYNSIHSVHSSAVCRHD